MRIKGSMAISKCTFARALLAHFAVFVTCALPKIQVGHKTGVLRPTCDLQFLHWNHTHSFCRTFLWRRTARRGSSILPPAKLGSRENRRRGATLRSAAMSAGRGVSGGRGSQQRQSTEAIFGGNNAVNSSVGG